VVVVVVVVVIIIIITFVDVYLLGHFALSQHTTPHIILDTTCFRLQVREH